MSKEIPFECDGHEYVVNLEEVVDRERVGGTIVPQVVGYEVDSVVKFKNKNFTEWEEVNPESFDHITSKLIEKILSEG